VWKKSRWPASPIALLLGSGKTTTLYAAVSSIIDGSSKIITIEDPVEYQEPGVLQMPVNERKHKCPVNFTAKQCKAKLGAGFRRFLDSGDLKSDF
jgi:hypothetical protein